MVEDKIDLQSIREADQPADQARLWLDASHVAARQGDVPAARRLAHAAVQADPGRAEAWLRLAWLTADPVEREACLRRVLDLDPAQRQARAELERLELAERESAARPPAGPARRGRNAASRVTLAVMLFAALLFLAAVLVWGPAESNAAWLLPDVFPTATPTPVPTPTRTPGEIAAGFAPELEGALAAKNWERALRVVEIMLSLDPGGEQVQRWAAGAYLGYGQDLVKSGRPSAGISHLDRAVGLDPANGEAKLWQQTTHQYLTSQQALADGDWSTAIEVLRQIHDGLPGYLDEVVLLAQAYRQRGIAYQEAGEMAAARADLEAALALQPGDAEAKAHLDEVMLELFPPKRIEVDLSKQHFYAWEGDELIYSFVTSTGLPGRDTAPGHFKVLDKIPMAYSSIWRLQMPYWLGIYYVGSIENGIHALPIRPDGTVMWGGLLGTRQSYGCVILSTEAARLIYDWAEVGTAVDIHY